MGSYSSITMCQYWDNDNHLIYWAVYYILLTCPNSDTLLCYISNPEYYICFFVSVYIAFLRFPYGLSLLLVFIWFYRYFV